MSDNYAISLKRTTALLAALTFMAAFTLLNFASVFGGSADAAQLSSRKLTLSSTLDGSHSTGTAGSATNGAQATHTFDFVTTDSSVSTVVLTYCTNAIGTCTKPTGLTLAATSASGTVVLSGGSNEIATITLTAPWGSAGAQTVNLTGVDNPDYIDSPVNPDDNTFFVRITAGDDEGTVASSVTDGIQITSRVAETLGFSTTGDFDGVGDPGATCAPVTGSGAITLGDPVEQTLSLTNAYDNYSAFRLYTNAANGVDVQYKGDTLRRTLTSAITALVAKGDSQVGEEQFGLAIDSVSGGSGTPATDVTVASSTAPLQFDYVDVAADFADANNGTLTIASDYADGSGDILDGGTAEFKFTADTATSIASTAGFTNCKTAAIRYIANISPLTPAGTYTTNVVYSAVPTY